MKHLNIHGDCCLHFKYVSWVCCEPACRRHLSKSKPVVVHFEPIDPSAGVKMNACQATWPGPQIIGVPLRISDAYSAPNRSPQCAYQNSADWSSPGKLFQLYPQNGGPGLPPMLHLDGRWFESVDEPGLDSLIDPRSGTQVQVPKLDSGGIMELPSRRIGYCVACGGVGNHRLMCPTQKVKA